MQGPYKVELDYPGRAKTGSIVRGPNVPQCDGVIPLDSPVDQW